MHITPCLEPRTIFNSYTKELQVVPCGKCAACLNAKAARMVERLEVEATCHQYVYFVTLTFDNEHLPVLKFMDDYLVDLDPHRMHWKLGAKLVNVPEELHKLHTSREVNLDSYDFIKLCQTNFGGLPYLSSVVFQKFIKRLRKYINTHYKKLSKDEKKILPEIRYYLAGEYGPTTYRPHAHLLLFFSSDWLASHIYEYVRAAWQFGNIDTSFVEHSASSYVASYLNSVSHLPAIYRTAPLRPFALFSKHPAIGTLVYNAEDIKQMFFTNTLQQVVWKQKKSLFDDVPLWRTIQDRIYPRLSFFDFIDSVCLCKLYAAYENVAKKGLATNINAFKLYVESNSSYVYKDYIELLKSFRGDYEQKLQRWYLVSKRVYSQASAWNISVKDYVFKMLEYFAKFKQNQLKEWYRFAEDYTKEHTAKDLVWLDPLYLRNFLDCDITDLTYEEITYLESFNIDLPKFFSDDLEVRYKYQSLLYPDNTYDYKLFYNESCRTLDNSTKTKRKNDYAFSKSDWYVQLQNHGFFSQNLLGQHGDDLTNNSISLTTKF